VSAERWNITFIIYRQKGDQAPAFQSFPLEVDPDEYVLDGIERIWAFHDRSLVYRHACHHSTCGACGMRVNSVEKLTCITSIRSVTHNGGSIRVEPLRNFPVVADLAVDMGVLYRRMELAKAPSVVPVSGSAVPGEKVHFPEDGEEHQRLVDCIECGCCISACPVAVTTQDYFGPAVLAGGQLVFRLTGDESALDHLDCADGLWRCHSGFECTAVCPSAVDPAWRIMDLRRATVGQRMRTLFGGKKGEDPT
jgi:succinate dehydrogenase / fumarate reductase iron-sulfur subunit